MNLDKSINDSIISMDKIFVKEFLFLRNSEKKIIEKNNLISFDESFEIKNNNIIAELSCNIITNENIDDSEFIFNIKIKGLFKKNNSSCDNSLKNNIFAIMFPFLRTQVSLLTTQPDFTPVVLPVININTLLDEIKKNKE